MTFNEQQLKAINCNDRTILCLAGAGVGKTACLVARVIRLVREKVDPRSILVLTFTNAAAFEMAERFKLNLPNCKQVPEFRTFHSFAYSLLVRDPEVRSALKYIKIPDVCDDKDYKQILSEAKLQLNPKLSLEALERDPDPMWTMKQKHEYDTFHALVQKLLRSKNLVTFDMLNTSLGQLFSTKDKSIQKYFDKYKHVIVDEFQDTDPVQMKFLSSFPDTTNFFLVGDALQSIYQFRNCSNEYIKMLSNNPDWTHIKLFENYRSTREICEFANKMSRYADSAYRIEMHGQRNGDPVEVIYGASADYMELVDGRHMDKLVKMLKASSEGGAVLCRTNKEVAYVKDRLKSENIKYVSRLKDNSEVLNILKASADPQFAVSWMASMLSASNYTYYIRKCQLSPMSLQDIIDTFSNEISMKELGRKVVSVHNTAISDLIPLKKKFESIIQTLDVHVPPVSENVTDSTLLEYISSNIQEQVESQLYVGTIHSSKGLEYNHVYLMGVDDRSFQIDSEEMKNLYYVGLTRAKNHLTIFRR